MFKNDSLSDFVSSFHRRLSYKIYVNTHLFVQFLLDATVYGKIRNVQARDAVVCGSVFVFFPNENMEHNVRSIELSNQDY